MLKELCWATLSAHGCKMVVCYWDQMAKASTNRHDEGSLL